MDITPAFDGYFVLVFFFPAGRERTLPLEQAHVLLATPKAAKVDILLVEQFEVEIAKGSRFLKDRMGLMPVPATGHNHG